MKIKELKSKKISNVNIINKIDYLKQKETEISNKKVVETASKNLIAIVKKNFN